MFKYYIMKNLNLLVIAISVISILQSCKDMGGASMKKTLNEFDYKMIKDNEGPVAKEGDYVYFRYTVKSKDSIVFTSMQQVPMIKFKLPKQVKIEQKNAMPISDVIYAMSKGDSAIVYQKLDAATKASIGLPNAEELTFEVYLDDIKDEAAYNLDKEAETKMAQAKAEAAQAQMPALIEKVKMTLADYKSGKANLQKTNSGIKYIIHEEGTGAQAESGKTVSVNYYGALISNGERFDDSFSRGEEFSFPLGAGQVIKGWDEGIALMKEGSKATFFIPYQLAYGEAGSPPVIPTKADLMFYVEMNKVK